MNPRSEIQKGDLVEIITSRYSSWNEIPDHEKQYYEAQREQAPTRGQRFIVAGFTEFPQKKAYAAINGRACLYTAVDCLMKIEPMMDDDKFKNSPIHDKRSILDMMDKLDPANMAKVVDLVMQLVKLPIGTKIKFTKKLFDEGETGYIVGHGEKGYSAVVGVFENNPHGPFMVEDGEFETID